MAITFKLRRGPSSEWTSDNPVLAAGEPGVELDTGRFKIGNGVQSWNELPYIIDEAAIQTLIQIAIEDLELEGIPGPTGASAYEVAVANGFVGTEVEWLASLEGAAGSDGAAGLKGDVGYSAYEVAVSNGFVGTESQWLSSLRGPKGETGVGLEGADGMSAYDIAVSHGFEGTEVEWLESLKGEPGSGSSGSTSGYFWDPETSEYVLAENQRITVGPELPSAPSSNADIWFNTSVGGAIIAGFDAATSLPKDVVSSGVAHVPGDWVEYVASTPIMYGMVTVTITNTTSLSGNTRSILMDIGVGSAGSEEVIVAGLDIGRDGYGGQTYPLPLIIPAGSRVSLRIQSRELSLSVRAQLTLTSPPPYAVYYDGEWRYSGSGKSAIAFGITPETSLPAVMTVAPGLNTWSPWTVLADSTPEPLRWLLVIPSGPIGGNWGGTNADCLLDVASGSEGEEVSLINGAIVFRHTTQEAVERAAQLVSVDIPAGTRLAVRYQTTFLSPGPPAASVIGIS